MVFLMVGYGRQLWRGAGGRVWLGLIGLVVAFAGAVLQQMKIGMHPDYFNHNALYHLFQFMAFSLVFASIPALERRDTEGAPRRARRMAGSVHAQEPELVRGGNK